VKIFDACFAASCLRHAQNLVNTARTRCTKVVKASACRKQQSIFLLVAKEGKIICIDF